MKKARDKLNKEETALRERPGDFMLPENVFENGVGRFWGLYDTRDYMRARYALADKLLQRFTKSAAAVAAALDHMVDMLRLNRSDNMGLRDAVPALYLRLGRDQEAYDFIKWWAVCDGGGSHDRGDTALPHLDVRGADALEDPEWWTGEHLGLSHAAAAALVKIRALLDLFQGDLVDGGGGVLVSRRGLVDGGGVLASRRGLVDGTDADLAVMIGVLLDQVDELFDAIGQANRYFWSAMADPAEALATRPGVYSRGTKEEAFLMVRHSYRSWEETPGAINLIRGMCAWGEG